MSEGQTTALKGDCVTLNFQKNTLHCTFNIARLAIYICFNYRITETSLLVQCPVIVKEEYASTPMPPKCS